MVQGNKKSGRFRKVQRKVPGGRTVTRYEERRPRQAHCGESGKPLHGIPRRSASEARNAPKSSKRPERPYGGVLGSEAMRKKMLEEATVLSDGAPGTERLYSVGSLCLKIAGRDAGKRCVIVEERDGRYLVDGETRRRTCSARHLEPLGRRLELQPGATRAQVAAAFTELGVELHESKAKQAPERPKRQPRKKKPAAETAKRPAEQPSETSSEQPAENAATTAGKPAKTAAPPPEKGAAKASPPKKAAPKVSERDAAPAKKPAKSAAPAKKTAKKADS